MSTYASYSSLYNECALTPGYVAFTDRTRFSCPSLPEQSEVRKSIDIETKEKSGIDCTHGKCVLKEPENCDYKNNKTYITENFSKEKYKDENDLLPVMEPYFNMREICKQCILLEDHLSHPEKRCYDCCIKHFLTIEALAEEAITLDTHGSHNNLKNLPSRIRNLQRIWHQDPIKNAYNVSQGLRKIRKDYQIQSFQIVFDDRKHCEGGICKIRK